jgi:hypothetical protein
VLSIVIPTGFVTYADHTRQTTGISWLVAPAPSSPTRS